MKACDTCRYYLKMIDLTADEDAIPVADELVTISLNLRAGESGYPKRAPNPFGMELLNWGFREASPDVFRQTSSSRIS